MSHFTYGPSRLASQRCCSARVASARWDQSTPRGHGLWLMRSSNQGGREQAGKEEKREREGGRKGARTLHSCPLGSTAMMVPAPSSPTTCHSLPGLTISAFPAPSPSALARDMGPIQSVWQESEGREGGERGVSPRGLYCPVQATHASPLPLRSFLVLPPATPSLRRSGVLGCCDFRTSLQTWPRGNPVGVSIANERCVRLPTDNFLLQLESRRRTTLLHDELEPVSTPHMHSFVTYNFGRSCDGWL
jgi:hypothetical protein